MGEETLQRCGRCGQWYVGDHCPACNNLSSVATRAYHVPIVVRLYVLPFTIITLSGETCGAVCTTCYIGTCTRPLGHKYEHSFSCMHVSDVVRMLPPSYEVPCMGRCYACGEQCGLEAGHRGACDCLKQHKVACLLLPVLTIVMEGICSGCGWDECSCGHCHTDSRCWNYKPACTQSSGDCEFNCDFCKIPKRKCRKPKGHSGVCDCGYTHS